jgi:hypothetical protein
VEQVVVAEACTARWPAGIRPSYGARRAAQGFDSPVHNAAQHSAQVTRHGTQHTTMCRSTTMRAGTGNSTQAISRNND